MKMGRQRLFALLTFAAPLLLIGPYGWQLTRVERSQLPLDAISSVYEQQLNVTKELETTLRLLVIKDPAAVHCVQDLKRHFQLLVAVPHEHSDALRIDTEVRELKKKHLLPPSGADTIEDDKLDDILNKIIHEEYSHTELINSFTSVVFCQPSEAKHHQWVVGKYRHAWAFIHFSEFELRMQELATNFIQLLSSDYRESYSLTPQHALSYRLSFCLVNEDSSARRISWNFPAFENTYLNGFLSKLRFLANITTESEIMHFGRLSSIEDPGAGERISISSKELQGFLSANDWMSHNLLEAREKVLRLMVFLPRPMSKFASFVGDGGYQGTSFVIPGWGGVQVIRSENGTDSSTANSNIGHLEPDELQQIAGIFIAQIRRLLGLPGVGRGTVDWDVNSVRFLSSQSGGIADWELDVMLQKYLKRHLASTAKTLRSIAKLVTDLPHMTVLPRISDHVRNSLDAVQKASKTTDLYLALHYTRMALKESEAAYYDSTMVPQLYFPDEHLLAVYAPLIAPLLLPFISAFAREVAAWKLSQARKYKGSSSL